MSEVQYLHSDWSIVYNICISITRGKLHHSSTLKPKTMAASNKNEEQLALAKSLEFVDQMWCDDYEKMISGML